MLSETGIKILVVDDENSIRRFLNTALTAYGHTLLESNNGANAIKLAATNPLDLIILDLGLPDMDGVEVTRRLREWIQIPIIILSVRDNEADKITALDAGADDYITKPFGIGELMARMRVALRRANRGPNDPVYQIDQLKVDLMQRRVTVNGQDVSLTPTEYDLLRLLARHAGKVITHTQLLHSVWGAGYEPDAHLLRVNMSNLRHKIEPDPARPYYIQTEPGVGYRMRG